MFPYRWPKQRFGDADLVNIHGMLDGESIFGIDGSDNLDDRDILPFTKTYRVLKSVRGVPSGSIAYPSQRGGDGLKTSSIVFFGHSLSRADYSYFESIFSTVDLYNWHTSLVFLYSNYAKSVRESEVAKVLALLDYYGASLGIAGCSTISHISSCWRADSSFRRFRSICLCRKWVGSASSRCGMMC